MGRGEEREAREGAGDHPGLNRWSKRRVWQGWNGQGGKGEELRHPGPRFLKIWKIAPDLGGCCGGGTWEQSKVRRVEACSHESSGAE